MFQPLQLEQGQMMKRRKSKLICKLVRNRDRRSSRENRISLHKLRWTNMKPQGVWFIAAGVFIAKERATADRHPSRELDEDDTQMPTLSLDYFYMNQNTEATLPRIVVKCHKTKRFWASVVPKKGDDPFATAWLGGVLDDAGFTKVLLKSDGEPALVTLKQRVKETKTHIEIHLVETPVDTPAANGYIEVGVREIKRQRRALLSDLQTKLGWNVEASRPLMVWLPRHAAFLLTRYRVGTDGKTAFERTYGRKWRIPLVRFGESILYRPRANRGGADGMT